MSTTATHPETQKPSFIEVDGRRVNLPPREEAIRARHAVLEELAAFRQEMAGRWSGTSAELLAEARADRR